MANLKSQPGTTSISLRKSANAGFDITMPDTKFSPLDETGAVLDLTGYNAATLKVSNAPTNSTPLSTSTAMTVGTADATGIVIGFPLSLASTICSAMGQGSFSYTLTVTDGADVVIAGQGTVSVQEVA